MRNRIRGFPQRLSVISVYSPRIAEFRPFTMDLYLQGNTVISLRGFCSKPLGFTAESGAPHRVTNSHHFLHVMVIPTKPS
jgi:hypothetical protein